MCVSVCVYQERVEHTSVRERVENDVTLPSAQANPPLPPSSQARNVLLKSCASESAGVVAKVSDFGLSIKMAQTDTHVSSLVQVSASAMGGCGGKPFQMKGQMLR